MDKEKRLNKINDVEKNLPECVNSLGVVSSIVLWAGVIVGLIVIVLGFIGLSDDIFVGISVIASGIGIIASFYFGSVFFEGMKEITANTYRSAEYAKIQLEIACSEESEDKETANKVQKVDDELPML